MNSLPHGITDPLHLDEPFPTWILLVVALVVWLLYRWFRYMRARSEANATPVSGRAPRPLRQSRIGSVIEAIRRRTHTLEDYRAGCHELAAALREHFGRSLAAGVSFEHSTADEIARRVGDTAVSRYFRLLSELQFFRRSPSRSDFDGACDLALDVIVDTTGTASAVAASSDPGGES